jgi:ribosome assembly protein 4
MKQSDMEWMHAGHQVWEVASRKLKLDLPGHADEVFTVDWSPDGASVASGGKDQVLRIWRQ